ncbi:MAG TPA: hypothetical protein VIB11_04520 [Pedococcus sp.]|jgi:hypothetical protein|uniref:hypothetical protein n=1 Tax=Pedococcus sp. TaxID=2860345 RepID=UPI002F93D487
MQTITKAAVRARISAKRALGERGDVPGWVLITLMTAGLVTVLWAVADDQLQTLFRRAMGSVSGP